MVLHGVAAGAIVGRFLAGRWGRGVVGRGPVVAAGAVSGLLGQSCGAEQEQVGEQKAAHIKGLMRLFWLLPYRLLSLAQSERDY